MVTIIIIAITVISSIMCFGNRYYFTELRFSPYEVWHRKKWWMLFSHALVHGGWGHLLFNMLTLYFFGRVVEEYMIYIFGHTGGILLYLLLYVSSIAVSSIWDLFKHKNDWDYSAVGASGAVSAVLFAAIYFEPGMEIFIYFIPIPIPGYIFAPLYLLYCWWMAKKGTDNIGHTAHFWGSVYGLVFPILSAWIGYFFHHLPF